MATEQAEADTDAEAGLSDHFRAVTITAIAALAGIVAAFVSEQVTAGMPPAQAAKSSTPLLVVVAAVGIQALFLSGTDVLKEEFGTKDFLYVAFLTISLWFIAWGILLTSAGGV